MRVIDATNLSVGRLASNVAKAALKGEEFAIVNSEKAVITGTSSNLLKSHHKKIARGVRYKGPFYPKRPDRMVKRAIRGMLPYKKKTGSDALDRVKAYIGVPKQFEGETFETIENAKIDVQAKRKYLRIGKISKSIGSNWDSYLEKPKVIEEKPPKEEVSQRVTEPKKAEKSGLLVESEPAPEGKEKQSEAGSEKEEVKTEDAGESSERSGKEEKCNSESKTD